MNRRRNASSLFAVAVACLMVIGGVGTVRSSMGRAGATPLSQIPASTNERMPSLAAVPIGASSAGGLTAIVQASPTSGAAPLLVSFTGSASGGVRPYAYAWTFGDQSPASSSPDVVHTYVGAGTYTATLVAADLDRNLARQTVTIVVAPATAARLTVELTATQVSGSAPVSVSFTATAGGGTAPYAYAWSFDDGTTSTQASPTHVFQGPGTYTVVVTAFDARGRAGQQSTNISVTMIGPAISGSVGGLTGVSAGLAVAGTIVAIAVVLVVGLLMTHRRRPTPEPAGRPRGATPHA
jgi:PKD repeat protein